jgi:hypothetical protein
MTSLLLFTGLTSYKDVALVTAALLVIAWIFILRRWQRGIWLLWSYIPVSGLMTLFLFPALWPKEVGDAGFILPAYVGYALTKRSWRSLEIPRPLLIALGALTLMVVAQTLNPHLLNWRIAAIGVKVWLFYLPLIFLGYSFFEDSVIRQFLRLTVCLGWIPVLVEFCQYAGDHIFGYTQTMEWFYGRAASAATQGFAYFHLGAGTLFRVPGTFTFPTQYFNYLLILLGLTYASLFFDSRPWRTIAVVSLPVFMFAAYLSGMRASFILVPFLSAFISGIHRGWKAMTFWIFLTMMLMFAALKLPGVFIHALSSPPVLPEEVVTQQVKRPPDQRKKPAGYGVDMTQWITMMDFLVIHYPRQIAFDTILDAGHQTAWGHGTGMGTGAARFAISAPEEWHVYENYYAKTILELGIPGVLVVIALFSMLIYYGFSAWKISRGSDIEPVAAALLGIIVLFVFYDFKGFTTDLDPINMCLWLFAGFLLKIRQIKTAARLVPQ